MRTTQTIHRIWLFLFKKVINEIIKVIKIPFLQKSNFDDVFNKEEKSISLKCLIAASPKAQVIGLIFVLWLE